MCPLHCSKYIESLQLKVNWIPGLNVQPLQTTQSIYYLHRPYPSNDLFTGCFLQNKFENKCIYFKDMAALSTSDYISIDHTFKVTANLGYLRPDGKWVSTSPMVDDSKPGPSSVVDLTDLTSYSPTQSADELPEIPISCKQSVVATDDLQSIFTPAPLQQTHRHAPVPDHGQLPSIPLQTCHPVWSSPTIAPILL